jgi:hypothetical protein
VAEYEYTGPGPHEDPELGLVRPGDVREFDEEPAWGPWRLIEPEPDGAESDSPSPATQLPAPKPENPPPSGSAPPPASLAAPASKPEGM